MIQSVLLIYGSISPNIITWTQPRISSSSKTVFIKSLSIQDIQDNLLLTSSAEDFTDPATRSKLAQLTKEKGIQAIMDNTKVDILNHQVSVQYLYKENLINLGENYYGTTKRILTLHNKLSDKPEIASEINKYMQEQINNENYVEDRHRRRQERQSVAFCGL